jgi:methylmalonyl-CoA mutase cobalamin-binding domain/chain
VIYERVIRPILEETGRLWQAGDIPVAQEHFISGAIRSYIVLVQDRIARDGDRAGKAGKTVIIACIAGESHDIGSLILAGSFRMAGWEVFATGADTPLEDIAAAAETQHADVVALSVTMPQHLPALHRLIRMIHGDAGTMKVPIIVGGRPFSLDPLLWKKIGADGFASSADEAVAGAGELVAARKG